MATREDKEALQAMKEAGYDVTIEEVQAGAHGGRVDYCGDEDDRSALKDPTKWQTWIQLSGGIDYLSTTD